MYINILRSECCTFTFGASGIFSPEFRANLSTRMFKRKRLYERGDSYRDTGIPCGNPKRVQTGEVLCMPSGSAVSAAHLGEHMETEGEKHLREMAQKQLKTDLTMHDLVSQQRKFTEAGRYKPLTKEIKGVMGFQEYQDLATEDQHIEMLRQCGLSDSEIRLHLRNVGMDKRPNAVIRNKGTYTANPEVQQDQLHAIETKMKEKEASLSGQDKFRGRKEMTRQEMDIEKSMFQGTDCENKSLSKLLTEKKSDVSGDPNDPINHLPQMLAEIEDKAKNAIREKRRRRRRNRRQKNEEADNNVNNKSGEDEEDGVIGCLTFEEMMALKEAEKTFSSSAEKANSSNVLETPSSSSSHRHFASDVSDKESGGRLDFNESSVNSRGCETGGKGQTETELASQTDKKVLQGHIEFLPVEYIEEKRLSLEQIRRMPKFENYEAGSPSNVLYVKNLSPRVSERDLVALFGQFQREAEKQIVYRLMTGRMRGQAFVSFVAL